MSENPFFLLVFYTFGKNVATLDCLVRSSYPQLHGIVNLSDPDCTLSKDKFVTENELSINIEEHLKEIEGIDFEGLKNGHD